MFGIRTLLADTDDAGPTDLRAVSVMHIFYLVRPLKTLKGIKTFRRWCQYWLTRPSLPLSLLLLSSVWRKWLRWNRFMQARSGGRFAMQVTWSESDPAFCSSRLFNALIITREDQDSSISVLWWAFFKHEIESLGGVLNNKRRLLFL